MQKGSDRGVLHVSLQLERLFIVIFSDYGRFCFSIALTFSSSSSLLTAALFWHIEFTARRSNVS